MRPLYFLFPQMGINSGGHIAQVKFLDIAKKICNAIPVTYKEKSDRILFLPDVLASNVAEDAIYIVHWGPNVQDLLKELEDKNVVYFAHSTGWKIHPSPRVPIVAVSKHSTAYWGKHAPNSLIHYLPNVVSDNFKIEDTKRPIDVLIQKRKSSTYLLECLVPALRSRCNVLVQESWVEDLSQLFKSSKIYLYDSTEHWHRLGASEGFGLPPLEAMACGCTIFSSVNDALSDYLDPGMNCNKIRVFSTRYDADRILDSVQSFDVKLNEDLYANLIHQYREDNVKARFQQILRDINHFFSNTDAHDSDITLVSDFDTHSGKQFSFRMLKHKVTKHWAKGHV